MLNLYIFFLLRNKGFVGWWSVVIYIFVKVLCGSPSAAEKNFKYFKVVT